MIREKYYYKLLYAEVRASSRRVRVFIIQCQTQWMNNNNNKK
jgi:hypothetical protein